MTTRIDTEPDIPDPPTAVRAPRSPVDLLTGAVGLLLLALVLVAVRVVTDVDRPGDPEQLRTLVPGGLLFTAALGANLTLVLLVCYSALRALFLGELRALARAVTAVVLAYSLTSLINSSLAALFDVEQRVTELIDIPGDLFTSAGLGYVAAGIAFVRTMPSGQPRIRTWMWGGVVTATVCALLAGVAGPLALLLTVVVGVTCAALVRYGIGTSPLNPALDRIHAELHRFDLHAVHITPAGIDEEGNLRYLADLQDGSCVDLSVLSSENTSGFWRRLRDLLLLRGPVAPRVLYGLRRRAEHATLMAHAVTRAGVLVPQVLAIGELGPGTILLAREVLPGRTLDDLTEDEFTDTLVDHCWAELSRLHHRRIAHGHLRSSTVGIQEERGRKFRIFFTGVDRGTVAASSLKVSLDTAAMLTLLAMHVGEERAVQSAVRAFGVAGTGALLPFLQPAGLPPHLRTLLRAKDRGLLGRLREHITAMAPEAPAAPARLERMRPRTVVSVVVATAVGLVLLYQLAGVDFATIRGADLVWTTAALVMATICMIAATMVLIGFVPIRLPWWRTFLVQYAASFVRIAAPAGLGSIAVNTRFVIKAGAPAPLALSAVGLSQLVGLLVHVPLLLICAYLTGTSYWTGFTPSPTVVALCIVVSVVVATVFLLPRLRHAVVDRVRPYLQGVLPRLLDTLQNPTALSFGLGGTLLLTVAFILCLHFSVLAFISGAEQVSLVAVAVVFLAGNAVGSAAPTPGGLGAVEVALIGGLTAVAGVPAVVALPAVLLFRLLTFWLPVLPGWAAFSYLQRREAV